MLISDFNERHKWIPQGSDQRYEITFLMGKGTGLVSGSIPGEYTRAIAILVDRQCRARAGVSTDNPFVFAYTKHSSDGTTGYNEIMSMCRLIDIPVLTATEGRHRSPSAFCAMDNTDDAAIDCLMDLSWIFYLRKLEMNINCFLNHSLREFVTHPLNSSDMNIQYNETDRISSTVRIKMYNSMLMSSF